MARLGAKLFRSEVSYLWKNTFMVWIFLLNRPLTYFRGQTDCLVCLVAKLFRMKTSPHLASEASEIVFPKNTFSVRIFLLNRPLTYFRGQMDCLVCLGAKLFRTKTSPHLASEASEIVFPKNTFSVRIFLLNSTTATIRAKRTIWRDWGQNCSGVKFRISEKTRLWSEFFY